MFRRTARAPNEQWQADHTLLDIAVLDKGGDTVRPWLTVVLDDCSRAVAGYTVFIGAPTAERTALALHQVANRKSHPAWPISGLPESLYSDHGSDFTSARLERVCLETHIRLIHSRVGVPQGRGKIERFYGTITTELLPHLPGRIPHGTGADPPTAGSEPHPVEPVPRAHPRIRTPGERAGGLQHQAVLGRQYFQHPVRPPHP